MFILALIPFLLGYMISARLLGEKGLLMRLSVSYALGLSFYLILINIPVHFYPIRTSLYLTLIVSTLLCLTIFALKKPAGVYRERLGRAEAVILIALSSLAFFYPLLWQMWCMDDDYSVHGPLMALFLKDNYPPMNPFFPDMPYAGHYGKNLIVSSLSVLFGERFLEVQFVMVALNQSFAVLLGYLTAKRYLKNPAYALFGIMFVFMGTNNSVRKGLLETFQNNNSFVYLLFFLNIYLYFHALTKRDTASKVVAALSMGAYALVYETHYGILLAAFLIFPTALSAIRRRFRGHGPLRFRWRHVAVSGFIVLASLIPAFIQGGTLTNTAKRYLFTEGGGTARQEDMIGVTQEISVKFPKEDLLLTAHSGDKFSIFSARMVKETGFFMFFFPVTVLIMALSRNYYGILWGIVSVIALLVPATVDFGRFNVESLRLLFVTGMGAAMLFGISIGVVYERLSRGRLPKAVLLVGCFVLLYPSFYESHRKTKQVFKEAVKNPEFFFFDGGQWTWGHKNSITEEIDVGTARKLKAQTGKGDSILPMVYTKEPPKEFEYETTNLFGTLTVFSGAYTTGMGVRVEKEDLFQMGKPYLEPIGFRERAFWNTGDVKLLGTLNADFLYLNPEAVRPDVYERLKAEPGLELILREEDPKRMQVREVYRVRYTDDAPSYAPSDFKLHGLSMPQKRTPRDFFPVPAVFGTKERTFDGRVRLFYKVFYNGKCMNPNDEIIQTVGLKRLDAGRWAGELYFIAPYEEGVYDIELHVLTEEGYKPLDGKAAMTVSAPDKL